MCNVVIQDKYEIRPGEWMLVIMVIGPGGKMKVYQEEVVWGGSARVESKGYWKRQGGEEVVIPGVKRWGEIDEDLGKEEWEDVPPGKTLAGILMPETTSREGRHYRLLKVVTAPAAGKQLGRFEKDRAVALVDDLPGIEFPHREARSPKPPPRVRPPPPEPIVKPEVATQGELF